MFCESILYGDYSKAHAGLVQTMQVSQVLTRAFEAADNQRPILIILQHTDKFAEVEFLLQKMSKNTSIVVSRGSTSESMKQLKKAQKNGNIFLVQASDLDEVMFTQLSAKPHLDFRLIVCATKSSASRIPLPLWHADRVLFDDMLTTHDLVGDEPPLFSAQVVQLYRSGAITFDRLMNVLDVLKEKEVKRSKECLEGIALETLVGGSNDSFLREELERRATATEVGEVRVGMSMEEISEHFLRALRGRMAEQQQVVWEDNKDLVKRLLKRIQLPEIDTPQKEGKSEKEDVVGAHFKYLKTIEVSKLNEQISLIRNSLFRLAQFDDVVGDQEEESIMRALSQNEIPRSWGVRSNLPLDIWIGRHEKRVLQVASWLSGTSNGAFWLPGLFDPQSFFGLVLRSIENCVQLDLIRAVDAVDEEGVVVEGLVVVNARYTHGHLEPSDHTTSNLTSLVLIPRTSREGIRCPIYLGDEQIVQVVPRAGLSVRAESNIYFRIDTIC
jgi:hypothetical protein